VAILAALACTSTAAAQTTIGTTTGAATYCNWDTVYAAPGAVVPNGQSSISAFRYQSVDGNAGQRLEFKVFRPVGGGNVLVVASTAMKTLQTNSELETFPVDPPIAVQPGDFIGFYTPDFLQGCAAFGGPYNYVNYTNPQPGNVFYLPTHGSYTILVAAVLGAPADPDTDGDGVLDASDNCDNDDNADQANLDGDAEGDACDADDDNDNVADGGDDCDDSATGAKVASDGCDDPDEDDKSTQAGDNCPTVSNADQADNDDDGSGDVCDADDDNDTVADAADNCPTDANSDQADGEGDGIGDVCDPLTYAFDGFYKPIDNKDSSGAYILNRVKAGAAVPVKFSLGGDQGLAIFTAGYPGSKALSSCNPQAAVDTVETTVTAGNSSLQYDAITGVYTYVWKTDKAFAGTCRQFVIKTADGGDHRANFQFVK
jgi:hypothetical protein